MKRKEALILTAAGLLALTTALAGCSREAEPEDIAVQIDTVVGDCRRLLRKTNGQSHRVLQR